MVHTLAMDLPLAQGRTEEDGSLRIILPRSINEAIEALRPLQRHQRAVLGMRCDEGGIEAKRFFREDSYSDLYPRLTKTLQPAPRHTREGVRDGDDDARDALLEDEIRTGRSLPVVRAGLQRHVDR